MVVIINSIKIFNTSKLSKQIVILKQDKFNDSINIETSLIYIQVELKKKIRVKFLINKKETPIDTTQILTLKFK